jgi:DMSO/TMAO reductase YedYZ heme-binding membrane subunit
MSAEQSGKWTRKAREYFTLSNTRTQWVIAFCIVLALTIFYVEYHVPRGRERWSLFTWNKGISLGATIALMITMSISLISQLTGWALKNALKLRRALGVVSAVAIVIHIILSLFFISEDAKKYDLAWYLAPENYATTVFGLLSAIIFFTMWYYSYKGPVKSVMKSKGLKGLKLIHRFGYLAIGFIILHLIYLNKLGGTIRWFKEPDFSKPPPGTLTIYVASSIFFLLVFVANAIYFYKNKSQKR